MAGPAQPAPARLGRGGQLEPAHRPFGRGAGFQMVQLENFYVKGPKPTSYTNANALSGPQGLRFIDFETACTGPLEWDLAHLGDDAVRAYTESAEPCALMACRVLVSVKTAARCWAGFEHAGLRWHARHHLSVVRRLMATPSRRPWTAP
jgi:hypothetical protein